MDEKQRRLYRNLSLYGGIPEMAAKSFREFTFDEYLKAALSEEFKVWYKEEIGRFYSLFDGVLIGDLFREREAMENMKPKTPEEHSAYARRMSQYVKLIDRTAPIVERMRISVQGSGGGPAIEDKLTLVDGTPQA